MLTLEIMKDQAQHDAHMQFDPDLDRVIVGKFSFKDLTVTFDLNTNRYRHNIRGFNVDRDDAREYLLDCAMGICTNCD